MEKTTLEKLVSIIYDSSAISIAISKNTNNIKELLKIRKFNEWSFATLVMKKRNIKGKEAGMDMCI